MQRPAAHLFPLQLLPACLCCHCYMHPPCRLTQWGGASAGKGGGKSAVVEKMGSAAADRPASSAGMQTPIQHSPRAPRVGQACYSRKRCFTQTDLGLGGVNGRVCRLKEHSDCASQTPAAHAGGVRVPFTNAGRWGWSLHGSHRRARQEVARHLGQLPAQRGVQAGRAGRWVCQR